MKFNAMDQPQAIYDADGQVIPVAVLRDLVSDLPSDAFQVESFHLPGQHDQSDHGRKGTGDDAKSSTSSVDARAVERRLTDAYAEGYTVDDFFSGGQSGASVQRITLSDGTQAVRKRNVRAGLADIRMEYLAGRVYSVLSRSDVVTAQVDDQTLVTTFVDGPSGSREMMNKLSPGALDAEKRRVYDEEIKRQVELPGAQEIGMLDWLTNNTDRHSQNWIITADGVRPIDQGDVRFTPVSRVRNSDNLISTHKSPFADHWIGLGGGRGGIITEVKPKFTEAELIETRSRLESLRDEFNGPGEQKFFDAMMSRFEIVEKAVRR
jgi:FlaG/FlaF family flagellin (archaellin)